MSKNKFYSESFKVYLVDTCCYGNATYISYHKWISIAKENFFLTEVAGFSDYFFKQGIKLIVLENHIKIAKELKLHDNVTVTVRCKQLKKLKLYLQYQLLNNEGEIVAEGEDKITFVDSNNGIVIIPDKIDQALKKILI
ncbi:MAG: thioesterase family protein [Candidatus Margulisbacteria bacterium]|nr:thioesterase family protein [Candidatus Margulisiibacteriota bacterium]